MARPPRHAHPFREPARRGRHQCRFPASATGSQRMDLRGLHCARRGPQAVRPNHRPFRTPP
eukprot:10154675-Lingulodinium_polyedra.AAC.1